MMWRTPPPVAQWNSVTPEPDALTINVGDQCQVGPPRPPSPR